MLKLVCPGCLVLNFIDQWKGGLEERDRVLGLEMNCSGVLLY
jgi:hypothetical protein